MPPIFFVLSIIALTPIALAIVGSIFRAREFGKLDNNSPRDQQAKLSGAGARAVAAQKNAWETLSFFCAVVIIAMGSKIDLHSLSNASYVFLAARILHPIFYIANLANLRSTVFAIGWISCLYICYQCFSAF